MHCSLEKLLKKEHETMKDPRHNEHYYQCPIFGKQICLWCCLHISDAANPLTRNHTLDIYPGLSKITNETKRTFDSIAETCSRCRLKT